MQRHIFTLLNIHLATQYINTITFTVIQKKKFMLLFRLDALRSDSEDIYNCTNDFVFQINAVLLKHSFHKIKQQNGFQHWW